MKDKKKQKKMTGSNTLAEYIKGHPATTIPIFSITVFIASYLNKWGYFSYFNIHPMYINFNLTQLIPNINQIMLWILFFSYYILIIVSDKMSKGLQKTFIEENQSFIKEKGLDKDKPIKFKLSFLTKSQGISKYLLGLLILIYLLLSICSFLHESAFWKFAIAFGVLTFVLTLFLLFIRQYMVTMLILVCWICLVSFKLGFYSANTQQYFDIVKEDGTEYAVVDYYDDKYILIKKNDLEKMKNGELKAPSYVIKSVVNNPLVIIR